MTLHHTALRTFTMGPHLRPTGAEGDRTLNLSIANAGMTG